MNSLKWIENSAINLILHLFILILAILNFNYQFLVTAKEKQNQLLEIQINQNLVQIEDINAGFGISQQNFFKDKEIRNQGYKFLDETIIDTSSIEPVLDGVEERRDYIPVFKKEEGNQFQKWMDCLFYGTGQFNQEIHFCKY
jgi:hypothetical protein